MKKLGLLACCSIVVGNMMGSGIALLPANLAAIGSVTIISWVLAACGAVSLALVFSSLGASNPQEGGLIAYAGEVSPILGYQTSVLYFNASWIGNLAIAITGVTYLSYFFPQLEQPIPAGIMTIVVIWCLALLNLLGVRVVGHLVSFGVLLLSILIVLIGIVGWFFFDPSLFKSNWNMTGKSDFHGVFAGFLLCIWSFIGVESASVDAALVDNPKKNIPRATTIGVLIATVLYFLSSTVIFGLLPAEKIAHSGAPFSLVSSLIFAPWAGYVVSLIVTFVCLASLGSWMLLTAQAGARAAHDGAMPAVFGSINAKGVPVKGILIMAVAKSALMLLMMVGAGSVMAIFGEVITIAVLMTLLPYFYSVLNYIDYIKHPVKTFATTLVTVFAIAFCLSGYLGAKVDVLIGVLFVALGSLVFYVRKNRETYEKKIYRDVHHWKIEKR